MKKITDIDAGIDWWNANVRKPDEPRMNRKSLGVLLYGKEAVWTNSAAKMTYLSKGRTKASHLVAEKLLEIFQCEEKLIFPNGR